jgi:thiol-disulfide isomerase/thioredoxin
MKSLLESWVLPRSTAPSRFTRSLLVSMVGLALLGCGKSPEPEKSDRSADKKSAPPLSTSAAQNGNGQNGPSNTGGPVGPMLADDQLRMMPAPAGDDVTAIVKAERDRQAALGRTIIVYAGAKWCEPCQHFHKAAAAGKLDKAFPKLTIIEFDVDEDGDRLKKAGYRSKFIPLFIVPDENGRPTERRLEGSVKGNGAVDEIVPRLRQILGSS